MSRDHGEFETLVNDHADGLLAGDELRAMEEHLEQCDRCAAELESTLALKVRAGQLPRELAPPRDLWPEIRARLQATGTSQGPSPAVDAVPVMAIADWRARRRWSWSPAAMRAAAAVALVVLSSGATALLLRRPAPAGEVAVAPATQAAPQPTAPVTAAPVLAAFSTGEQEVESLRSAFESRRARLAPETVATIERNLAIIDRAIAEARAALQSDPGNPDLPLLLSDVYRKKVELLQDAVRLQARS